MAAHPVSTAGYSGSWRSRRCRTPFGRVSGTERPRRDGSSPKGVEAAMVPVAQNRVDAAYRRTQPVHADSTPSADTEFRRRRQLNGRLGPPAWQAAVETWSPSRPRSAASDRLPARDNFLRERPLEGRGRVCENSLGPSPHQALGLWGVAPCYGRVPRSGAGAPAARATTARQTATYGSAGALADRQAQASPTARAAICPLCLTFHVRTFIGVRHLHLRLGRRPNPP